MLVLSRRMAESLLIGDDISITILRCDSGQVRIGIDAPKHINIVRTELLDQPDQELEERDIWKNQAARR